MQPDPSRNQVREMGDSRIVPERDSAYELINIYLRSFDHLKTKLFGVVYEDKPNSVNNHTIHYVCVCKTGSLGRVAGVIHTDITGLVNHIDGVKVTSTQRVEDDNWTTEEAGWFAVSEELAGVSNPPQSRSRKHRVKKDCY